jgi:hypothetical protein
MVNGQNDDNEMLDDYDENYEVNTNGGYTTTQDKRYLLMLLVIIVSIIIFGIIYLFNFNKNIRILSIIDNNEHITPAVSD